VRDRLRDDAHIVWIITFVEWRRVSHTGPLVPHRYAVAAHTGSAQSTLKLCAEVISVEEAAALDARSSSALSSASSSSSSAANAPASAADRSRAPKRRNSEMEQSELPDNDCDVISISRESNDDGMQVDESDRAASARAAARASQAASAAAATAAAVAAAADRAAAIASAAAAERAAAVAAAAAASAARVAASAAAYLSASAAAATAAAKASAAAAAAAPYSFQYQIANQAPELHRRDYICDICHVCVHFFMICAHPCTLGGFFVCGWSDIFVSIFLVVSPQQLDINGVHLAKTGGARAHIGCVNAGGKLAYASAGFRDSFVSAVVSKTRAARLPGYSHWVTAVEDRWSVDHYFAKNRGRFK
jgi:hypothetical protein